MADRAEHEGAAAQQFGDVRLHGVDGADQRPDVGSTPLADRPGLHGSAKALDGDGQLGQRPGLVADREQGRQSDHEAENSG